MVVWSTHFVLAHFLDSTVTSKWQREEEGGPFWTKKRKTILLIEIGRGHFGLGMIHTYCTLMYDTSE